MPKTVIADSSCLIILSKIGELNVLRWLYQTIYITPEIATEFGEDLPPWIFVETVQNQHHQRILLTKLDRGEATAIALALEKKEALIILDDLKGRKIAKELGLVFTGTLGVISRAKELGYYQQIKPILIKILQTNFRISQGIIYALLDRHGETI